MADQLSLEEFLELAKQGKRVAVFQEISSDFVTPISAYHALKAAGEKAVLLESGEKEEEVGRHSFIGLGPVAQFSSKGLSSTVTSAGKKREYSGHPFESLRALLAQQRCVVSPSLPLLAGGAIGFITYDAVRLFEKVPDRHVDSTDLPDIFFLFHEAMIIFHHLKGTVTFSVVVDVGDDPAQDYTRAMQKIEKIKKRLTEANGFEKRLPHLENGAVFADLDDESYCGITEQAKSFVSKGDAFQIVLSRSFKKETQASPLDIYRALRTLNPSPFMFLIETEGFALVGASPERLVSLKEGIVETMPIAGGRPRGKGEEDLALEKELLADEKEQAEHMMLVDLGRNDLGRICKPGSVKVKELKTVRRFSHVMHLVSKVTGVLKEEYDALDALQAVFPAGTLSGAPKIRAMEIIDELESSRRGIYGGAICQIDSRGDMDSCIAIRTAFIKDGIATVRAGAGIVYDSVPQSEADESRHKARAVLEAIKIAEEACY